MLGGDERVVRLVRERAGHAFDPQVADCLIGDAERILTLDAHASVWEETLACEPDPPVMLAGEALDRALAAMGNFADLISPYLTGHSGGVADWPRQRRSAAGSTTAGWRSGARRSSTTSDGSRCTRGSGQSRGR